MSTVLEDHRLAPAERPGWQAWAAILPGLALLYVPTFIDLARGLWRDDAYAHGPLILAVFAWLLWRGRAALLDAGSPPAPWAGAALLGLGLAAWLLGRTQSIMWFEAASLVPVMVGLVLAVRGVPGVRRVGFALLFLLFYVPLPGFVLDFFTTPLKGFVSAAVAGILGLAGYAVERSGVVLSIGARDMLVADACSGLNSITSLFALGLLYAHLMRERVRPLMIVLAILPIALFANILRVLALVLVTHHFGPEAATGFFHDAAGMLVFVVAFLLLAGWGQITFARGSKGVAGKSNLTPGEVVGGKGNSARTGATWKSNLTPIVAGLAMAGAALAAPGLKPVPDPARAVDLEAIVPVAFAGWRIDPAGVSIAPTPDVQANLARLYGQIVSRTYVNDLGERMMLTVAHGGDQSDALKAHRQEVCYAAQGFEIVALAHGTLRTAGRTIPVTRMLAVRGDRSEPVTYWFTMGDRVVQGRLERLAVQLRNGFAGRVPDGMLVRVSSISGDANAALSRQQGFIADIVAAMAPQHAARLVGAAGI